MNDSSLITNYRAEQHGLYVRTLQEFMQEDPETAAHLELVCPGPCAIILGDGSLYFTHSVRKDLSKFWRIFERLKKKEKK